MSRANKKLTKKRDDSMVAGVCAGLADYYDTDPTLVRAVFIAASLVGGFGPALYIVLWILLDDADPPPPTPVVDTGATAVGSVEPPPVDTLADGDGATEDQAVPDPAPTKPEVELDPQNPTPGL